MLHRSARRRAVAILRGAFVFVGLLVSCPAAPQTTDKPDAPSAAARTEARPFLWRIDGTVPSWLLGTFHLPDERVTDLPEVVERALADADALFAELDMDQAMSPALMNAMRMPDGRTLRDVVPAELRERVGKRIGGEAVFTAMNSMRPVVVAMQVLAPKQRSGTPLDLMLWKDAKSAGKEVGALETIEEQIAAMTAAGIDGEVAMLRETLDHLDAYEKRGLDLVEEMIVAYCAGDTQRTVAFFEEMNGDGPWKVLGRTLLTDRNLRMAERIDRRLRDTPKKKFVFAVGAGHLIGETNVVDLLRARGFVVTRVPESAVNIDEELTQLQREVEARQQRIDQLRAKRAALAEPPRKKAG